jgi:hypothetical protein
MHPNKFEYLTLLITICIHHLHLHRLCHCHRCCHGHRLHWLCHGGNERTIGMMMSTIGRESIRHPIFMSGVRTLMLWSVCSFFLFSRWQEPTLSNLCRQKAWNRWNKNEDSTPQGRWNECAKALRECWPAMLLIVQDPNAREY